MPASEVIEAHGHLIDSGHLSAIFDRVIEQNAAYEVIRFDIGRTPNKHLAFGFGVHYCLGAMLARMELKALFGKILPHLASVEQAGDSALTKSGFVSGVKRLPIRYTLK